MQRTVGLSPKFTAAFWTAAAGWLISSYAVKGDPKLKYGLTGAAAAAAAFLAPPGFVVTVGDPEIEEIDGGVIVAGLELSHNGEAETAYAQPPA